MSLYIDIAPHVTYDLRPIDFQAREEEDRSTCQCVAILRSTTEVSKQHEGSAGALAEGVPPQGS